MKITKMHGAGNDFLLINNLIEKIPKEKHPSLARALCRRRLSFGADGLILLDKAEENTDFRMAFFNSDGSAGEMCANGARCLARFAFEEGVAGDHMYFETTAGPVEAWRLKEKKYRTRLQLPTVCQPLELNVSGKRIHGFYVEIGHPGLPHFCLEYPQLKAVSESKLRSLALSLRHHAAFPKGANVNFYSFLSPTELLEKTFERGVEDFTLACGSGSVSVVYALMKSGRIPEDALVTLHVPGGRLEVDTLWSKKDITEIFLTGPVERVYDTTYQLTEEQ